MIKDNDNNKMDGYLDPALPPLADGSTNQNPIELGFWALIKEDFNAHERRFVQGFWVLLLHRYGNWRMGIRNRYLRIPFSIIYKVLFPLTEILFGISLGYTVKVGRRVKLEHFGGMVLVPREIGNDVTIRQNTTMGIAKKSQLNAKPIIGDRVDIGCGVAVLGNIKVGHDCIIGANAVVISDLPPYSVAAGVPAKVVRVLNINQDT